MRRRIYEIIEIAGEMDRISRVYDIGMMCAIVLSLLPLAMKSPPAAFIWVERVTVAVFLLDYFLRLLTADYKLKMGARSFLRYPFTPMAVVDLLSVLPSLIAASPALKVLRVLRLLRTLRVLRVFKAFRYSKNMSIIAEVFRKQKNALTVVCGLAVGYILTSALIVFTVEPETFPTFFDAVYWATVSLTTVGYGDIYATSFAGKLITMLSSIFGIAIVALPAGVITAGYMKAIEKENDGP